MEEQNNRGLAEEQDDQQWQWLGRVGPGQHYQRTAAGGSLARGLDT